MVEAIKVGYFCQWNCCCMFLSAEREGAARTAIAKKAIPCSPIQAEFIFLLDDKRQSYFMKMTAWRFPLAPSIMINIMGHINTMWESKRAWQALLSPFLDFLSCTNKKMKKKPGEMWATCDPDKGPYSELSSCRRDLNKKENAVLRLYVQPFA